MTANQKFFLWLSAMVLFFLASVAWAEVAWEAVR